MDRRTFFGVVFGGLVAAGVTLKLTPILPHDSASAYLLRAYNNFSKGKGAFGAPKLMLLSQDLFNKFESELVPLQRYVPLAEAPQPIRSLVFKCCRVQVNPKLKGWDYAIA